MAAASAEIVRFRSFVAMACSSRMIKESEIMLAIRSRKLRALLRSDVSGPQYLSPGCVTVVKIYHCFHCVDGGGQEIVTLVSYEVDHGKKE